MAKIKLTKSARLIGDEDMGKLFRQLDRIGAEGLENYVLPLAIRLQLEFAGRRSEIIALEWRKRRCGGVTFPTPEMKSPALGRGEIRSYMMGRRLAPIGSHHQPCR